MSAAAESHCPGKSIVVFVVVRQLESELCVVNDREKEQPLINSADQKRFNKSTIYTQIHSFIHSFTRFDSDIMDQLRIVIGRDQGNYQKEAAVSVE